ncbi:hypothetical protein F2Q69_00049419 [Brassica cretica]|uniref:Uncharacterized protein n=1 Tax=Brassica cretica TaxID=69181 RepID=A0A8S9PRB7_BRACR|nr:hypothetical protein F2Q69_00049419 [Brassica cretica]
MNDFDLSREWYDWVGQDSFQGRPHHDPINHIAELEDLVLRRSLTSWEDIERAFLYKFLDEAEATREKEKNDKWDRLVKIWHIKKEDLIPRQLVDYIMAEGDEHHGSREPSKVYKVSTRDSTSTSIDDSTHKSTDVSSCSPSPDVEKLITMKDFLELEEFLGLEDGEKLEDLDLSREVTMEDFLEIKIRRRSLMTISILREEIWRLRQRLASIDANMMKSIDIPYIINRHLPYDID